MKKELLTAVAVCFIAGSAVAQYNKGTTVCSYTPMQDLIRNARSADQVQQLINSGVQMNDATIKCGGNLLQLAIRRGNTEILGLLLSQNKSQINANVSLTGFEIPGAPKEVPLVMFAAYYAPSEAVFQTLMNAGVDVTVLDTSNNSALWYMDQNPVLRETPTADQVRSKILYGSASANDGNKQDKQEAQPAKK